MVRAFIDAPIDQTVTDGMKQALVPMLTDAIEKHSVSEFCVRYHDIVSDIEKAIRELKQQYPQIVLIYLREPQGSDKDDDLHRYFDVDKPVEWQHENCQVRLVMYNCSKCTKTKNNSPCDKRDMFDGKVASKHIIMRLEDYIKE